MEISAEIMSQFTIKNKMENKLQDEKYRQAYSRLPLADATYIYFIYLKKKLKYVTVSIPPTTEKNSIAWWNQPDCYIYTFIKQSDQAVATWLILTCGHCLNSRPLTKKDCRFETAVKEH